MEFLLLVLGGYFENNEFVERLIKLFQKKILFVRQFKYVI